jgi:hypothetical protein
LANACASFGALFKILDSVPESALAAAVRGKDPQARYLATVLLGLKQGKEIQRDVFDALAENLLDDENGSNDVAAFSILSRIDADRLADYLDGFRAADWQQAAWLRLAAALKGVKWTPDAALIRQWNDWKRDKPYPHDNKCSEILCAAAIFATPKADSAVAAKDASRSLTLLRNEAGNLKSARRRAAYARERFLILCVAPDDPTDRDHFYWLREAAGPLGGGHWITPKAAGKAESK